MFERGPERFRLIVPGQAAGAGSKTAIPVKRGDGPFVFKDGRLLLNYRHASDFTEPWMKKVADEARKGWKGAPPLDGALWLDAFFFEARGATQFLQRQSGAVLHPQGPAHPHATDTHDHDKMRRAICDSLKRAGVIVDDKRIVGGEAWKAFADKPPYEAYAEIRLGVMLHQTVEDAEIPSPPPAGQETLA